MKNQKFLYSLKNALNGIRELTQHERNIQIHLILFTLVIILGFIFSITLQEWTIILLISAVVISLEAINTAIEKICDYITPKDDKHIKQIKDISAGAVLIASILAATIGIILFLPYILQVLSNHLTDT